MALSLEMLSANREVAAWFATFDVSLEPEGEPSNWFAIDDIDKPHLVGSDGSGGAFVLLPAESVLYVSSEGRAGIIASSFEAFVQLVLACPYWLDILKFSAGGDLAEMRRAAIALEARLEHEDDVNEARDAVCEAFDLAGPDDAVGALYEAVAASDAIVRATDGSPFTTLFNRFSIDSNPTLRAATARVGDGPAAGLADRAWQNKG